MRGSSPRFPFGVAHDPLRGLINPALLHTASRQFGILSRAQLVDAGVSTAALSRARRAGMLIDVTNRTVRVRSSPDTFLARCAAVSLHLEALGFLSGPTAGRLHGLRAMPHRTIHATIPEGHRVRLPTWARVRWRSRYDADLDRTMLAGVHITAEPHRMLHDLAARLSDRRFRRAAEDCWHLGLVTPQSAEQYLRGHRRRGKDGTARMDRWLELALDQRRPAQSGLELDLIEALRSVGLPEPVRQHPLELSSGVRIHVDIAWPDARLCVEPGHSWWHGGNESLRRDHERSLEALAIGWETITLDESLRRDPRQAARMIRRAFEDRTELPHGRGLLTPIPADRDADRRDAADFRATTGRRWVGVGSAEAGRGG